MYVLEDLLIFERVRDGNGSSTRDRVSSVGSTLNQIKSVSRTDFPEEANTDHRSRLELVSQLLTTDNARQRETVRQALRTRHDIRPYTRILDREVLPGTPEPALHLVDDKQDTVLVADFPETLQEGCGRGDVAALAEHRLDEDRSSVARRRLLRQKQLELVQADFGDMFLGRVHRRRKLVPVRVRQGVYSGLI